MTNIHLHHVRAEDVAACYQIETQCFGSAEAATRERIQLRQKQFPQGFFVAERQGEIVGFINSGATNDPDLSKEEFKELIGHDPDGRNLVIFSLAVRPDQQHTGISRTLMTHYLEWARAQSKQAVLLLCKPDLVNYYKKIGFSDLGPSQSDHGGLRWHEMRLDL